MINASKNAKNDHQYDNTTMLPQLNFHLKVLIYSIYKNNLEKPTIATSTDLASSMTRAVIAFFPCQ